MTTINFSMAANSAANTITKNQRSIDQAMTRLSSGKTLNSSADGPGMIGSYNVENATGVASRAAVQSMNHGISYLSTVDGAASTIEGLLVRMKDLAVQASNTAMSQADRYGLDAEFQELGLEWTRISTQTQFNGAAVMTGTDLTLGAGRAADNIVITLDDFQPSGNAANGVGIATGALTVGLANSAGGAALIFGDTAAVGATPLTGSESISVADDAQLSSIKLTGFIAGIAASRSKIGGAMNALAAVSDSYSNAAVTAENSASRIGNTDYAAETSKLSASQIISQASTAILAQANAQSATILSLLK